MSRTAFLFALMSAVLQCSAQLWCPPGATWFSNYRDITIGDLGYVETTYVGDTIIEGVPSQHLVHYNHIYSLQTQSTWIEGPRHFYTSTSPGLVRVRSGSEFDTLFYFNAVPGDHWAPPDYSGDFANISVTDTGHVMIDGQWLRFLAVDITGSEIVGPDTLFERIGFKNKYVHAGYSFMIDNGYAEVRCYSDDEMSYQTVDEPCAIALGVRSLEHSTMIDIFPNPCTTQATVNWPAGTPVEQFLLTDASGRVVRQWKPSTRTAAQHTFSVEGLASGMYTMQVRAKDGVRSGRVLVAP